MMLYPELSGLATWSETTVQYVFVVWCLDKHRDNFTFYLLCRNANFAVWSL